MPRKIRRVPNLPDDLVRQPELPWLTWILFASFPLGVLTWATARPAMNWVHDWRARQQVVAARTNMDNGAWQEAAEIIQEAAKISPKEPEVLRVIADYQIQTQQSPDQAIQTLNQLRYSGKASVSDIAKLGLQHLLTGDAGAARRLLESVPTGQRSHSEVLELEAGILRREGRHADAEKILRNALATDQDDMKKRVRLAMYDSQQPFPEVRQRARDSLWEVARSAAGGAAHQAVTVLAQDTDLTPAQADELLRLALAHPQPQAACRYAALSAVMRLRPLDRPAMLEQEITRCQGGGQAEWLALGKWLASVGEHERLLTCLPSDLVAKSSQLLTLVLETQGRLHRWSAVSTQLAKAGAPLSEATRTLWAARVAEQLATTPAELRQSLRVALEAAAQGQDTVATQEVATIAERQAHWDLAVRAHLALAERNPQARRVLLEAAEKTAQRSRETGLLMLVAGKIQESTPEDAPAAARLAYLRLLTGEGLEVVSAQLAQMKSSPQGSLSTPFLQALAAFRLGQHEELRRLLALVSEPQDWPPGQRAVLAGLLAHIGEVARGYQLSERITASLLLVEERRLLSLISRTPEVTRR